MAAHDSTLRTRVTDRVFRVGLALLLLLTALYTAAVASAWSKTPLGQRPQGEAAAWLAAAESLHDGTMAREPFFRSPLYVYILSLARGAGVAHDGLDDAARVFNGIAHVLSTALVALVARRLWGRVNAGLLAGALWGFYPSVVFMTVEPTPHSLAVLAWLAGVSAGMATKWHAPTGYDASPSHRHLWAYPFIAGVAFVMAAALNANLWPTALGWPFVALLLDRESRGIRLVGAGAGVVGLILLLTMLQNIWGGARQPLPGGDLYRLSRALEITQPWAAPRPAVEFREDLAGPDVLEAEAQAAYATTTGSQSPSRAVMAGYWWRRALREITRWPARSALRIARKFGQFFYYADYGTGAAYARAHGEILPLKLNPLGWTVLLVAGVTGLALGARAPGAWLALVFALLAGAGTVLWYPTMEARAPVAAMLTVFSGALLAQPWPQGWRRWLGIPVMIVGLVIITGLPRRDDPGLQLLVRDSRRRALALAGLRRYDKALTELRRGDGPHSPAEREMAAEWRFTLLLNALPGLPAQAELESQLLDNAELAMQSRAAQFRSGVYLWLLGRTDGALFFWRSLAEGQDESGAAARAAIARSGSETAMEAQLRAAWEIAGSPVMDPALTPFLERMRRNRAPSP